MEAQDLIDSVEEDKKEIFKGGLENLDGYHESVIRERLKKTPSISPYELSNSLGITKEKAEELIKKIKETKPEKEPEPKSQPKGVKKGSKLKSLLNKLKVLDKEDFSNLKLFLFDVIIQGIFLNYAVYVILGTTFTAFSWLGWGLAAWFIERRFPPVIRSLWVK